MYKSVIAFAAMCVVSSVYAGDPVVTEELVNLTPANVCYKASIAKGPERTVLQKLSGQVPCDGTPGYVLPVMVIKKDGTNCKYAVGKLLNFSTRHALNNAHNFWVTARCPTDQK